MVAGILSVVYCNTGFNGDGATVASIITETYLIAAFFDYRCRNHSICSGYCNIPTISIVTCANTGSAQITSTCSGNITSCYDDIATATLAS